MANRSEHTEHDISSGRQRFYDRGYYRISNTGPLGNQVYCAWYLGDGKPQLLAVCKTGDDSERHGTAKAAVNEHWQQRQGVKNGNDSETA